MRQNEWLEIGNSCCEQLPSTTIAIFNRKKNISHSHRLNFIEINLFARFITSLKKKNGYWLLWCRILWTFVHFIHSCNTYRIAILHIYIYNEVVGFAKPPQFTLLYVIGKYCGERQCRRIGRRRAWQIVVCVLCKCHSTIFHERLTPLLTWNGLVCIHLNCEHTSMADVKAFNVRPQQYMHMNKVCLLAYVCFTRTQMFIQLNWFRIMRASLPLNYIFERFNSNIGIVFKLCVLLWDIEYEWHEYVWISSSV